MRSALRYLVVLATLCCLSPAIAEEVQSLSAQVGDAAFVSDDDSILLVPVAGTFTLNASTAGASAYPPPKTRIDRLSITCSAYTPGETRKFSNADFAPNVCRVSFEVGTKPMGGEPDAVYQLDKDNAENHFDITSAVGKRIEGNFHFRLKDAAGNAITISDGRFEVEDRQL